MCSLRGKGLRGETDSEEEGFVDNGNLNFSDGGGQHGDNPYQLPESTNFTVTRVSYITLKVLHRPYSTLNRKKQLTRERPGLRVEITLLRGDSEDSLTLPLTENTVVTSHQSENNKYSSVNESTRSLVSRDGARTPRSLDRKT